MAVRTDWIERNVFSWGRLRAEQGKFEYVSGTEEIKTKLGRIIFVEVQPMESGQDQTFPIWPNSQSASAVEDDPGWFHVPANLTAGPHTYFAVGHG